jgi:Zn-dependent M28 family amino/carboxypeptidase
MIHSVPTPAVISHSATWNGAAQRAVKKGAAAVLINLAIVGTNYQTQLNGGAEGVPSFSIGTEDADKLRTLIEQGPVTAKVQLVGERRSGLKDANVWGTLPGATDEDILLFAHHDAYFEGAIDNASGMAAMVALAEYFSKIPQAQRRRTLKFVTTSGHHAGSLGVRWMHDNRATFFAKTAMFINVEHVSATQTYIRGPVLRKSNNIAARRWWVYGSPKLASVALDTFKDFGVTVYHDMETRCCGDSSAVQRDVPNVVLMESPVFYHTDHDRPDIVPDAGLEAVARAYAKLIDQVNKLERSDLLVVQPTSTAGGQQ